MSHTIDTNPPAPGGWTFTQGAGGSWRWQRGPNGSSPATSEDFSEFGACISDAIDHGFRPKTDKYSTRANSGRTESRRPPPVN